MSTSSLQVINPFSEAAVCTLPMLGAGDVDRVVERARAAYHDWRNTDIAARKKLCTAWMHAFEARLEQSAEEVTRQMGKPIGQARGEVKGTLDRARHMIAIAEETLQDEAVGEIEGFTRYIRHEPKGVVLDIAAWNYPLFIAVNVVVPAVLAGNAVIIKHSSKTPQCGKAFSETFALAGAPEGLVQDIVADHAVTEALVRHAGVNHVSFTGSVRGGHEIVRSAADRFIDVGLELGGKDPAYVCEDAPFDFAVDGCVDGAFYNAGQSCCAVERIYVDHTIYDNFVEAFAAKTREYKLGDPMAADTTLGPLASKSAPEFLSAQIADAVKNGGKLVVSAEEFEMPDRGWFRAPAVVADAPQDCRLVQEESFGPVIAILPVHGDKEAIRNMNDSPYGLSASIWTQDVERAIRIGEQIETGTFFMNRCDVLDPALPWTGVKDTGRGASLSRYGLLQLTQLKSMHLRTHKV